ncbi:dTDP-4-dehydrorhamnose 3,5-epimerase family protein [Micromonospora sp. BRA006-A]|uniref:dTDP-4-dehydrorhamnose 3,5-epimerase family protein n=1 Tax=Micromonospora sp. BRA006-A TaxID=2962860 RepID=UPI00296ECFA9|nr:dTDP-4-dehydrorhamnose 3,5-epimerase family protein [Micromonospora sp. BRA006-A]MDW3848661.1 dTDP-4-dehydrorhamnose 3,5-epimerase family protein [Micromonospora sp. BRA006-A]
MRIEPLGLAGAYLVRPRIFPDRRGLFLEIFNQPDFADAVGHPFEMAQVNCSSSRRGTVRGLHGVAIPPGQARYATCVRGAIVDIVVDTRIGSPTFGEHVPVRLDDEERQALYLAEGLVHGFAPLTDEATVVYLCSSTYDPAASFQIDPFDPALGLPWPQHGEPILSEQDRSAPSLAQAAEQGLLPTWADCQALGAQRLSRAGRATEVLR